MGFRNARGIQECLVVVGIGPDESVTVNNVNRYKDRIIEIYENKGLTLSPDKCKSSML